MIVGLLMLLIALTLGVAVIQACFDREFLPGVLFILAMEVLVLAVAIGIPVIALALVIVAFVIFVITIVVMFTTL